MERLEQFIVEHNIDIAALTIPKQEAVKVAERLVDCGIKAFGILHIRI